MRIHMPSIFYAMFYKLLGVLLIFKGQKISKANYWHFSIYPVNVGTHKKTRGKQKPRKSRLLSSTKGRKIG